MTTTDIEKTKEYKKIKRSLLTQLKRKGTDAPYYVGLVEDYMHMYTVKELAVLDLQERGNIIYYVGSGGTEMTKKNESSDQIIKLNAQMIKILEMLDITPQSEVADDEDKL